MKACIIVLLLSISIGLNAQKKGCTDKQAVNYDATAVINDGSCTYPVTSKTPVNICAKLNDTITETSGVIYFNNGFWTINDSGNEPALYAFDSSKGTNTHKTLISGTTNTDWEEITQDDSSFYIGDFGNNTGDRKGLKIYIVKKKTLKLNQPIDTATAQIISFSYADQTSFTPANQNHDFDMEAMCVADDSIHLFSKDWVDKKTRHYVMPKTAGTYSLVPRESLLVEGQITSACANDSGNIIILGGYNASNGACFMWMLWDFKGHLKFNGNKRRIETGNALTLGQYEATTFKRDVLYITNEKRVTEAGLWRMGINQWVKSGPSSKLRPATKEAEFNVYQKKHELFVSSQHISGTIQIYNSNGQLVLQQKITEASTSLNISSLSSGIYTVELNGLFKKVQIEK